MLAGFGLVQVISVTLASEHGCHGLHVNCSRALDENAAVCPQLIRALLFQAQQL